ncbi:hypothetical protein [Pleurocapsa sp. PCC 7319]|uniref:hypothetical protein n=1 Tax=Pleurocapsa sp. PCC 7319 TaxID=118161 RepID=UPI0003715BD8|nr:hypothetical protein [Pleurocapsa sp. PCC 7319]
MKTIKFCLLFICLSYLVGCGQVGIGNPLDILGKSFDNSINSTSSPNSNLAEIATPKTIKELNKELEQYAPQVQIISPEAEQVLNQTDITVELQVQDLPIFQDDKLRLGNHLNLILDNEPSRPLYNLDEPIILENLSPGTHTIRVFATSPWGESFKNEGAYAQTTFSVLTETNDNRPDPNLPLLTYSNPTGTYSAEPLMLDYYLTNAPLHSVAQSSSEVQDWRIRATVNGTSFILENWQPIYLTGFNQGNNWIQLELIDETGNNIENTFNNTVRVINYAPGQTDTLAKLVTNKISPTEAHAIVEQNYYILPEEAAEIIEPLVEPENNLIESEIISEDSEDTSESETEPETETETETELEITTTEDNQLRAIPNSKANAASETITKQDSPKSVEESEASPAESLNKESEVSPETQDNNDSEVIPDIETSESEFVKPELPNIEVEPEKPAKTMTIEKVDSVKEEPLATIDIPQPKSVELTEDQVALTIPEIESTNISQLQPKSEAPLRLKKILISLRQKIEILIQLLPSVV